MEEIIILGAGLSGLVTAYNLGKGGVKYKVLEAQNRLGGRIHTIYGNSGIPMEMGATWFGEAHINLLKLLSELNIEYFRQQDAGIALFETMSFEPPQQYFVPSSQSPIWRIKNGTYDLIDTLHKLVGDENIRRSIKIVQIVDEGDCIKVVDANQNEYRSKVLVIAIPPELLINTMEFFPTLAEAEAFVLKNVQTWMNGSIKFAIEYERPFWTERGFSGSVYSQCGLATEIYDHTNADGSKFSIKGFLNGSAIQYDKEERRSAVIKQLVSYFGEDANEFIGYHDKIWNEKFISLGDDNFLPPHYNNGHPVLNEGFMNNKVFLTGTETSSSYGGYMEGAVCAANNASARVLQVMNKG